MMENGYLKIAMTTDSLVQVDADFISSKQLVIYDVFPEHYDFVDCIQFGPGGKVKGKGPGGGVGCNNDDNEDKPTVDRITAMIQAMEGCSVLFTMGLSDFQAVRVKNAKVFPVKMEKPRDITEVVERLQMMLNGEPPLWMVRVLKGDQSRREYLEAQQA